MFVMRALGYSPQGGTIAPIEFVSGLIPLAGLYFGVKSFKENDCKGHMGFLEALLQCFKILLIGGVITTAAAIIYVEEIDGSNLMEFSGRIFGALLLALFALALSDPNLPGQYSLCPFSAAFAESSLVGHPGAANYRLPDFYIATPETRPAESVRISSGRKILIQAAGFTALIALFTDNTNSLTSFALPFI
eukprot:gene7277-7345_t